MFKRKCWYYPGVKENADIIPINENADIISVNENADIIPVNENADIIPVYLCTWKLKLSIAVPYKSDLIYAAEIKS